jgi:hypothetical protein
MKKLLATTGLVLSVSSASNAFCLKQWAKAENRYVASMAAKSNISFKGNDNTGAAIMYRQPVRRQK